MGKFDGILIASDFDATLSHVAPGRHQEITVSQRNQDAIRAFTEEGGTFLVASGRAYQVFERYAPLVPFNAPCSFANGGEIYDCKSATLLQSYTMPEETRTHLAALHAAMPELGFELYPRDGMLTLVNPNEITQVHLSHLGLASQESTIEQAPGGWYKVLIEHERAVLEQAKAFIHTHYPNQYECIFSNEYLLELTASGVNKGSSVLWIADYLGIARENIYCIGDNENDLSMLNISRIPYAPANAVPALRSLENLHLMPHHNEDAVAAMIAELGQILC